MIPIFIVQKLMGHIDGSSSSPSPIIVTEGKESPNPSYSVWRDADQKALILINASFSEEEAAEILGLTVAHSVWLALENAYSNSFVERIQNLHDQLRKITKGTISVSEFGQKFKDICDQLFAIGHVVNEMDKVHWFLCDLGASFETFSTSIRIAYTRPLFRDLHSQAESHEMFLHSLHGYVAPQAASYCDTPFNNNRVYFSGDRGRRKRPHHCQLCRKNGHYENQCPNLASFASQASPLDANLAQAFQA